MVGCAALLTACGDDSKRQRERERTDQRNKELALMTNMTLAGPEIERRLHERLQSDGEIVVIKDKPGEVFVLMRAMPAIVSWTADCGLGGLNVSLKGIELELSDALLEEQVCKELIPLTAVKVRQILSGK
jgi:hypothetical protein